MLYYDTSLPSMNEFYFSFDVLVRWGKLVEIENWTDPKRAYNNDNIALLAETQLLLNPST